MLFDGDKAGGLRSRWVGHAHGGFDLLTIVVVSLLILGFSAFIFRAWRKWPER